MTTIKREANNKFHAAAMMLFYILQKMTSGLTEGTDLLKRKISGPSIT
jgi:hypothetical protein